MIYSISFSDKFEKSLDKIDKANVTKILKYLKQYIDSAENPRAFGKALIGNRKVFWLYRVGDYRIICDIAR
ncbi:MAG: type II toxin-antitoxin system RelE/ParE family toxin [Bacteroidales bacterium]|jgi:mRNA interferase RelE/StbE|nr:type II toxin-antitoxin system RelE/ParE family toxin [Bacteroidales bacterium]